MGPQGQGVVARLLLVAGVQGLNELRVHLEDHLPLELEGGAELPARDGEVPREELELLDLLGVGHGALVPLDDALLDVLNDQGVLEGRGHGGGGAAQPLQDLDHGVGEVVARVALLVHVDLEGHQEGEELPLVANQHAVAHNGELLLHLVLNLDRGDVLASGGDQEL